MTRELQNSTEKIKLFAHDGSGVGITGATISLVIKRDSDGYFWNGSSFVSGYSTVSMTQLDSTNLPGYYYYNFNTNGLADNTYTLFASTATAAIKNDPWEGELKIGGWVDDVPAIRALVKNKAVWNTDGTVIIYDEDNTTVLFNGAVTPAPSVQQIRTRLA